MFKSHDPVFMRFWGRFYIASHWPTLRRTTAFTRGNESMACTSLDTATD